jgi:hypothetical protein
MMILVLKRMASGLRDTAHRHHPAATLPGAHRAQPIMAS